VLPGGKVVVGREAENAKKLYPDAYRSEFKPNFGNRATSAPGNRPMTADGMAVEVLRFLRERALEETKRAEPEHVVATVPAIWERGNRRLMHEVIRRAGYRDAEVSLIPEPVAAVAHAFSGHQPTVGQLTVLVYDLGGGTFDCAVVRGDGGWFEVLGHPDGKLGIGGVAFDRLILGLILERFGTSAPPPFNESTGDKDVIRRWLDLRDTCEEIKRKLSDLSEDDPVSEVLTELRPPDRFQLTRARFETLIRPKLEQTMGICDRLLRQQLDMNWPGIDRIVPVGGSSRIPLVGQFLAEHSGRPVLQVDSPEMAVVLGAAAMGRRRWAPDSPRRVYVNGHGLVVTRPELGFDEIVALVPDPPPTGPYVTYTVTYTGGRRPNPAGSLVAGQRVQVDSGMIFNVAATDRS
jgi:molecular chaperone DnaK (HSP70)